LAKRWIDLESERLDLGASAGPRYRSEAGYNWLSYKEAFSPGLVRAVLDEWGNVNGPLLDAFAGSGTSLLVAAERGIDSIGVELLPYAHFVASTLVRAHEADADEVVDIATHAVAAATRRSTTKPNPYTAAPAASWALSHDATTALRGLSSALPQRGSSPAADLAHVALLSVVEKVSTSVKDGTSLRHRDREREGRTKRPGRRGSLVTGEQVRTLFAEVAQAISEELPKLPDVGATVILGDARRLPFKDAKIGSAFFSPPYPNRYDYSAIYQLELAVGGFVDTATDLRRVRKTLLRSHLEAPGPLTDDVDDPLVAAVLRRVADAASGSQAGRTIRMLWGYFDDMRRVLDEHARVMVRNAPLAVVVATQTYYGQSVPTDRLLAHMAERAGFDVKALWILRRKRVAVQQRNAASSTGGRESILILRRSRRRPR
jgi:DNA modification methylase